MQLFKVDYSGIRRKLKAGDRGYTTIHTRMRKYGVSEEEAKKMNDCRRIGNSSLYVVYNDEKYTLKMGLEKFLADNEINLGERTAYCNVVKKAKVMGVQVAFDNYCTNMRRKFRK